MKTFRKIIFPVLLATVWISLSEFVRNEFLFKNLWIEHYAGLGLTFPSEPVNGAIWGLWSLVFAVIIFIIADKFKLLATILISWIIGFVLMWLVVGNLGVLPFEILFLAIPLSIIEVAVAAWIIKKMN